MSRRPTSRPTSRSVVAGAAVALVVALVAALVGPAGAADGDPRAQRDDARRKKAALAADLDVLNASETELEAAVVALASDVAAQSAQVDAARQAVAAAEAEFAQAEADLAATTGAIGSLRAELVQRAVDTFVSPTTGTFVEVVESADPAEAGRKQALLDQVLDNDTDVVDQLQAAEEDLALQRQATEAARQRAEGRRTETQSRLAELEGALAEQARLEAGVEARQDAVLGEIAALSAAEAELNALIERRIAAAAAQRARDEAAARSAMASSSRSSASGSGGGSAGPSGSGGCVWPARGTVTSGYGSRWGRLHAGLDIAGPIGTPIWAAKSGQVAVAGSQSGYGNTVVLDHGGGMTTLYAHQSRIAVSSGQSVSQGQVIGYVGNTGQSTGPHLHFETRYGGSPRDPRGCLG